MELFLVKFIMFMLIILGVFAGGYYVGKNEKQNNFLLNCSLLYFSFYSGNLVSLSIFKIYIMKAFNLIQQEINLLVRQVELVTRLEEQKQVAISINHTMLVNKIDDTLGEIYPSYLKLREKYLTEK